MSLLTSNLGYITVNQESRQMYDNLPNSWRKGFVQAELASSFSNGPSLGSRMGCALFSGNRAIALGANIYGKSSPYSPWSVHAEIASLIRRKHFDDSNLIAYIFRTKLDKPRSGVKLLADSKPCQTCLEALKMGGVKRVRFFEKGEAKEIKI